jgi:Protein of unknown function DUF86
MVDEVRVLRLLRSIADDMSVLTRESEADEGRREDPIWLRGVKYTFVTAIEACVDIAQHICATEGWGPPADNGDAIRLLGAHGVITPAWRAPSAEPWASGTCWSMSTSRSTTTSLWTGSRPSAISKTLSVR